VNQVGDREPSVCLSEEKSGKKMRCIKIKMHKDEGGKMNVMSFTNIMSNKRNEVPKTTCSTVLFTKTGTSNFVTLRW
jgi:hypothetical protein